jgi:hypothetical protein
MPKYTLKASDGASYTLDSPNELTQDQLNTAFSEALQQSQPTQQQAPQRQQPVQPQQQAAPSQDNRSLLSRYWDLSKQESGREGTGALNAFYELGKGTANLAGGVSEALGNPWQENVDRNVNRINAFLKQREKNIAAEEAQRGLDQYPNVPGTAGEIIASSAMYPYRLGAKAVQTLPKVSGPLMEGAKKLGRVAREGAIGSVLFTPATGEGDYTTQKAVQAGVGGLAGLGFAGGGKVIGAAGGAIAKKIAGKTPTETLPVNLDQLKFADIQSMAGTNKDADIRAVNKVVDALKKQFPDDYQSVINEWATSGKPLMEVIPRQLSGLAETSAMYPQGEELAQKYFSGQAAGSAGRINKAIEKNVSPIGEDVADIVAKRVELGQEKAAPLYEEAFQSTGIAPLKNTLQKQWASSGNTIGSLRKELKGLQQEMDLTAGKEASRPFNVYGQSNINQSKRDLTQKIEAKTKELETAISEREKIASFMKEAIADEAAGKKAVWSPRLQEFLDSPSFKGALSKGKATIEAENLNKGKKQISDFEYGIKGYDANGEPIVSKVPNLRMLDAYKKGMDKIINSHKDLKGNLDDDGKLLAANQAEFVKEIDRIVGTQNPYARARKTAGDYITARNETLKGQKDFFSTRPDVLKREFRKLTPAQKSAYKDGAVVAARERMGKILETGGNPYPKLMGKTDDVKRWQQILSPQEFKNFYESLKAEDILFQTRNRVLGNSATARRQNLIKDFELSGAEVLTGAGTIKTIGLSKLSGWLKRRTSGLTDNMAGSVAKVLYEDNPRQKALLMKQVFGDERLSESEKKMIKDVYVKAEGPIEELKVRLRAGASATAVNAMQE